MNSTQYLVHSRCVGALIRKPRTWPPTVNIPLSAAAKLAESRMWQPVIWSVAQKRAARTLLESD